MPHRFRPTLEPLEPVALRSGFTPGELRAACGFAAAFRRYGPAARGAGVTVAIVDAWDDPSIHSDLATYSREYRLPRPRLVVHDLGGDTNMGGVTGWSIEIALDCEAVHALLPRATIDLVEAATDSDADLDAAERFAAALPGVAAISNSWGSPPDPTADAADAGVYDVPGVVIAAAAGDASGPIDFPADLPTVVSVGGTTLHDGPRGDRQTPWLRYATPPDVRAIGGPPGISVYGTSGFGGPTWTDAWGTSLSCPTFIAMIGAVDGVRAARGEAPLDTAAARAGLDGGPTTAAALVRRLG